jgi:hypothetical protein
MLDLKRHFRTIASITAIAICAPLQLAAQDDSAEAEEAMTLKVYPVADLVQPVPDFPYVGGIPTSGSKTPFAAPPAPTGGGGFGGFGGGGGGGFFSVADNAIAGLAAVGQAGPSTSAGTQSSSPRFDLESLRDAILGAVTPDEWDETGGAAVCRTLGLMLLIKHTEAGHREVEQLLAALRQQGAIAMPLTIEAVWLQLDATQLRTLLASAPPGAPSTVDPGVLDSLAAQVPSYRGQITCFSDQTVHLVSGERRTLAIGAIPTTGFSAVGYQPIIQMTNIGLLLETRASLIPGSNSAIVHIDSTITDWRDADDPLQAVGFILPGGEQGGSGAALASPSATPSATTPSPTATQLAPGSISVGTTVVETLDRVRIAAHQFITSARVPLDKPVLIGGLSDTARQVATPQDASTPPKQIYLVVKVSATPPATQ